MVITGVPGRIFVEMIEVPDHPWFVACQFHPELKSKPFAPHPLFSGFVRASLEYGQRRRAQEQAVARGDLEELPVPDPTEADRAH
jgi:CTP synthase